MPWAVFMFVHTKPSGLHMLMLMLNRTAGIGVRKLNTAADRRRDHERCDSTPGDRHTALAKGHCWQVGSASNGAEWQMGVTFQVTFALGRGSSVPARLGSLAVAPPSTQAFGSDLFGWQADRGDLKRRKKTTREDTREREKSSAAPWPSTADPSPHLRLGS